MKTISLVMGGSKLVMGGSKLAMGGSKVPSLDVTSNDQLVTCEFTIDPGLAVGKDDVAVTSNDGATATLPSAFEVTP